MTDSKDTLTQKSKELEAYWKEVIRLNVRKYRLEKGYTQEALAVLTGKDYTTISKLESKTKSGLSMNLLSRLSIALNVSIQAFFDESIMIKKQEI